MSKDSSARSRARPARLRAHLSPGQMVKTLRKLQGMTQDDLAEASGLDQSVISAMEHERTMIGNDRARKLAKALRVHPSVIAFPDWDDNVYDSASHEESDEPEVSVRLSKRAHQTEVA
jgi:transcriptional regulator with XRE-family HTH domain